MPDIGIVVLDALSRTRAADASGVAVVGIDGRGGSGKSTLGRLVAEQIVGAAVIELDDFYRPRAERPEGTQPPGSSYDLARLVDQVLLPARRGDVACYQRYDWDSDSLAEWQTAHVETVLFVEGVYSTSARVRDLCDLRVWVESSYETRLARGVERDGEQMRSTWTDTWMPAEDEYVALEHPDDRADIVVSGDAGQVDFAVLANRLAGT